MNKVLYLRALLFYLNCVVTVCILCLFLTVPWVGLQSVIVAFPGHTNLPFEGKVHW